MFVRYCSKECQAVHYPVHKEYCNDMKHGFHIMIPDKDYNQVLKRLKNNKTATLTGRYNEITHLKLMPDNTVRELPSGIEVIKQSKLMNNKEVADIKPVNNWGKLTMLFGSPIADNNGKAIFYDKKTKVMFVLDRESDKIIDYKTEVNL